MLGWSLIRVTGSSMRPMLEPGAFAVFKKSRAYAAGDVLLVDHPRFGTIVKRAADVGEKTLWLEGANATSLSR
ncbi:MAG: S24/S26 family peptidase, partial [Pseudomonadota bacterium]